jgi:D-alanine-D-alanine ligase
MQKINIHIEIVRCGIYKLSSMGLKSCKMIQQVLAEEYENVVITYINNEEDLMDLVDRRPDLVFLGFKNLESSSGEKIWISDVLDEHEINYTGSPGRAIKLDYNKDQAKKVINGAGLQTSAFFSAEPGQFETLDSLPISFPLFVKPPQEGGGKGIDDESVVHDLVSFNKKVSYISDRFQSPALVERYLAGREFSVALLEFGDNREIRAMPIELVAKQNMNGDRILSGKVKVDDTEHVISVNRGDLREAITDLAIDSFRVVGGRDYGRVDIRLNEVDEPHFLEVNLVPGLAFHDFTSYFTSACWIDERMNYKKMVLSITQQALKRSLEALPEPILSSNTVAILSI